MACSVESCCFTEPPLLGVKFYWAYETGSDGQTSTVLNLVISQEPASGQIHLNVVKAFDLYKPILTQKEDFLE